MVYIVDYRLRYGLYYKPGRTPEVCNLAPEIGRARRFGGPSSGPPQSGGFGGPPSGGGFGGPPCNLRLVPLLYGWTCINLHSYIGNTLMYRLVSLLLRLCFISICTFIGWSFIGNTLSDLVGTYAVVPRLQIDRCHWPGRGELQNGEWHAQQATLSDPNVAQEWPGRDFRLPVAML